MSNVIKSNEQFFNENVVNGISGWTKLPNGLILQWWRVTNQPINASYKSTTFPIPFPNSVWNINGTWARDAFVSGTNEVLIKRNTITSTGFDWGFDYDTNTYGNDSDVFFFAIGY